MLTPVKAWARLRAACMGGVCTAALSPRQTMPLMKPSDSGVGAISARTNWS
jgi:hypothetical protein